MGFGEGFEYALQFMNGANNDGWELSNMTVTRDKGFIEKSLDEMRKHYPYHKWRIVMREVSDWYEPEGVKK